MWKTYVVTKKVINLTLPKAHQFQHVTMLVVALLMKLCRNHGNPLQAEFHVSTATNPFVSRITSHFVWMISNCNNAINCFFKTGPLCIIIALRVLIRINEVTVLFRDKAHKHGII